MFREVELKANRFKGFTVFDCTWGTNQHGYYLITCHSEKCFDNWKLATEYALSIREGKRLRTELYYAASNTEQAVLRLVYNGVKPQ